MLFQYADACPIRVGSTFWTSSDFPNAGAFSHHNEHIYVTYVILTPLEQESRVFHMALSSGTTHPPGPSMTQDHSSSEPQCSRCTIFSFPAQSGGRECLNHQKRG